MRDVQQKWRDEPSRVGNIRYYLVAMLLTKTVHRPFSSKTERILNRK